MKVQAEKNLEVFNIGDDTSVKAGIEEENLPFVFELMSKNLYSDPIAAIVREITSNCFDAHEEAGVNDAVVIKLDYNYEDDNWKIVFKDVGIGISDVRFAKIYSNYFSSTKRITDDLIGGFGIGSKTPLSYQDLFYITSVHEGKKYSCMYSRGEDVPILDSDYGFREEIYYTVSEDKTRESLLNEEGEIIATHINIVKEVLQFPIGIDTDLPNGTTIEIDIKDGDLLKFENAVKSETCYFDNVYYTSNWQIENNYKLYEGETFKYRNTYQYSDYMHIIFGKVAYPIDYEKLEIKPVKIPVGVKFEIGELQVTPSRESIRYNEETNKLIKLRIDECIQELVKLHARYNEPINDILKWLETKGEKTYIKFTETDKLYIPVEYGVEKEVSFNGTELTPPKNPFFMYEVHGYIMGEKIEELNDSIANILSSGVNIYTSNCKNISKYKNAYLHGGVILKRKKMDYKGLSNQLNLYTYERKKYRFEINTPPHLRNYDHIDGKKVIPILGKARLIKQYLDYFDGLINDRSRNYDKIEVDKEWLQTYRLEKRQSSAAYLRKLQGKITYRNIDSKRVEEKISTLASKAFVIYKLYKEEHNLFDAKNLIYIRSKFRSLVDDKKVDFIEISKLELKKLKDLDNMVYIEDIPIHPIFNRMFRDYFTYLLIKDDPLFSLNRIQYISQYYYSKFFKLQKFVQRHEQILIDKEGYRIDNPLVTNQQYIKDVGKSKRIVNTYIIQLYKELKKVYEALKVVEFIPENMPISYKKLLCYKSKITKLNQELYTLKEIKHEEETRKDLLTRKTLSKSKRS